MEVYESILERTNYIGPKSGNYKSFEDVGAWQFGRKLKNEIYKISKLFPLDEKYCLTQQIRKVAISITANIAEGYGRYNW
jgi:hypothetical protein